MKKDYIVKVILYTLLFAFLPGLASAADSNTTLRRPISPDQPMWLIHIDTWNYPDPEKIIALVPKDIRPYVVMNISLSISYDEVNNRYARVEYGYETARSWIKACAQNQMWVMVQPASGAYSHFSDDDLTIYEEFFQDFPNFLGFSYAEQFWGFGEDDVRNPPELSERMAHLANLLELTNTYGGYLNVSICWNKWGQNVNPIGMLKLWPSFRSACSAYPENFILFDKHTQVSYLHDRESMVLGAYLSGMTGQYGIRYDDTGWTDGDRVHRENFTMATYGAPFLEHTMLTGLTVFDGPELIWTQCFREVNNTSTTDGYSTRKWETFPQFDKVSVDLFRKVLDGTVRIPDRQEVIDRSKMAIMHDVNSGTNDDKYSSPMSLYQGLYRMDNDGDYGDNWSFFKKTGRYPTIPIVYQLNDAVANTFETIVKKSEYSSRWSTVSAKVNEFNNLFPEEYTGDIYAARYENGWVTYNPYKTGQIASGNIPFKYNTSDHMELSYSRYTAGVIKEYSDYITVYLSNFDDELNPVLKPDVIKIYGSTSEPSYSIKERGEDEKSMVSKEWTNGVFTLTIEHNGPVDIRIDCAGAKTDRLTSYQSANISVPVAPPVYKGSRQYEAETFEFKNIVGYTKNGSTSSIRNYTGQGYLNFGTNATASVRDEVTVIGDGLYTLKTKYAVTGSDISTIDLYVNDIKVATPLFTQTATLSDWAVNTQTIELKKGVNVIEYIASGTGARPIYFDHIVVEPGDVNDVWMEAECGIVGSLWEVNTASDASNDQYVTIQPGNNSAGSAPSGSAGQIEYAFDINTDGAYTVWGRVKAPTSNDNAFWVQMDEQSWVAWSNITTGSEWIWAEIGTYTLTAGAHTFKVGYNEDGAQLDKLYVTNSGNTPSGIGGPDLNCKVNLPPFAFAGFGVSVIDMDKNGTESIVLDGSESVDQDGVIASYVWREGADEIATGENPTVDLSIGTHHIILEVTDNDGETDSSEIVIIIYEWDYATSQIWLEAECGTVGSDWETVNDANASNEKYVTAISGREYVSQAPANASGMVEMSFSVSSEDSYAVYARIHCPSYNDDSFWLEMDGVSSGYYNGLANSTWGWYKFGDFNLAAGEHTLKIGIREDGAKLDKFFITKYTDLPQGIGETASNCNQLGVKTEKNKNFKLLQNVPNPCSSSTIIEYYLNKPGNVDLSIFDMYGQKVATLVHENQGVGGYTREWKPQGLANGVYIYRLQVGGLSETRKLIIRK
ncbi:glycoside hydrolase family 98 domain-containing protein [Plebeiibacterium sediminum]|uniref:T9SS type A sorting domain-containing protein n=1 Tax=Plebeiibacterium sediminum TaxID=2992112 RepID=A0AAE3SGB7_9BACT|nr:glycoside hydrolase family 98 domain-containing protein [Plebeiobacterium sediminum]MCW3787922.1 T9SS type A sorting domain-containing protein [Plebeiobacterium sediminum]